MRQKHIVILAVICTGLLVAVVGVRLFGSPRHNNGSIADVHATNALRVPDQAPSNRIHVCVNLSKNVFVVIRKHGSETILGNTLFVKEQRKGSVLVNDMEVNDTYEAALFEDRGTYFFDPRLDPPVLDSQARPVIDTFRLLPGASPVSC